MTHFKIVLMLGLAALLSGGIFIYSGAYPIGADVPHHRLTYWFLETLRERAIARASEDISVPAELNTPERLLAGGADYNDMCAGCHLKPGKRASDMSVGLYPAPPNLSLSDEDKDSDTQAKQRFWIIKHGIKASGMPAWGITHTDERIWNMVAFIEQLPTLSREQYQILTARDSNSVRHH